MLSKKPGGLILFLLLLLMVSFLAITQETDPNRIRLDASLDEIAGFGYDLLLSDEFEEPLEWTPLAPPRWFRSNAGGMALEEIPSRLAAMRNQYALVIDYIRADELPEALSPYYDNAYTIEIRVLYEQGRESRRQWIFRDAAGITRLVAVFEYELDEYDSEEQEEGWQLAELPPDMDWSDDRAEDAITADVMAVDNVSFSAADPLRHILRGFIEIYNEVSRISEVHQFSEDGEEIVSNFFYHYNTMVKAESWRKMVNEEIQKIYTDNYRYNRSAALRSVERIYHAETAASVRISFPYRVLDAARVDDFIAEQLPPEFDFFGDAYAEEGYRMEFTTGDRGRVLSQSLLDSDGNLVWMTQNTWSGERIIAILKIEGNDERLIEFEYDDNGTRIVEKNFYNGVLERLVRAEGDREVEELYMDGEAILRAVWEDGRKIFEERIRNRQALGNRG